MKNRMMALLICCVLIFALLPLTAFAATTEQRDALITATKESYVKAQEDAQQESFNGFCGRLTSYQLWNLGINTGLITAHGNMQYELYSAMKKTSAGYYICSYSAEEYTLERALNTITCNGTKDVYNIAVCFQWTETEEGNKYGHSMVINGILNGRVYFTESFYTRLGGEEGNVVSCTIKEFAGIFEDWTLFEGVIHFAGKTYADACKTYPTDMFVRTRYAMELRSQPCMVGTDNCKSIRSVSAGERLRVTALLKNTYDEWYYQVEDGKQIGYLVADTTIVDRVNTEEIQLNGFELDAPGKEETDLQLEGVVRAKKSLLGAVDVVVTDQTGKEAIRCRRIVDDYSMDLDDLNEEIDFSALTEGVYTVSVYGETATAYIARGNLSYKQKTFLMGQETLLVGNAELPAQARTMEMPEEKDGWYWEEGTWYLYENNRPVTGWVKDRGVSYYLKEDGSVTVGEETIEDVTYHFTDTGAMCVGWLNTNRGIRYLQEDGLAAVGWQIIDGSRYFFDDAGNMKRSGTKEEGDVTYRFQYDGKAIEVKKQKTK